jgi:hypothetical protein
MSDETQTPSNADYFRKMADRIDHNKDAGFGGACVFIPPQGMGEPIEILILDTGSEAAQFYSTVATRLQITLDKLQSQNQVAGTYGRR